MAFIGKTYNFVKHENFDTWLKSVGVPDDKVSAILAQKSTQKIEKNGDSYVISSNTPAGVKDTTFKSGVEFDDTIGEDKIPIKTTYTVDGETVTQTITAPKGNATFKREFNGNDLVVTITSDNFDGVAKRYYKA